MSYNCVQFEYQTYFMYRSDKQDRTEKKSNPNLVQIKNGPKKLKPKPSASQSGPTNLKHNPFASQTGPRKVEPNPKITSK